MTTRDTAGTAAAVMTALTVLSVAIAAMPQGAAWAQQQEPAPPAAAPAPVNPAQETQPTQAQPTQVTPQPSAPTPPTPLPKKAPDPATAGIKKSDIKQATQFMGQTPPGQPLPDDPKAIRTLDDAIAVAFQRSPGILQASERVIKTDSQIAQILSIKKPQISIGGTYSRLANESSNATTVTGASPSQLTNPFGVTLGVTPPGASTVQLSTSGTTGGVGSTSTAVATSSGSTNTTSITGGSSGATAATTRAEAPLSRQTTGNGGTVNINQGTNLNQVSARANVSQLIDITGLIRTAEQLGDLEKALSRIDLARVRQQTALDVKNSYFNLLKAVAFVNVNEAAVAQSQENLRVTEAQLRAGVAAQYDVLRARTQVSNNQQALITSRNQVAIAKNALANTLGIDPSTPIDPQTLETPPLPELDEEALIQQAYSRRPEYLEADISLLVSQKNIRLAHRNLEPYVNVGLNSSYNATPNSFVQDKATASLGIGLTIPLYDGGVTREAVAQARSDQRTALVQKDQFARGIKAEVQQAIISVRDADERGKSITQSVTEATEALRLANVRYRAGVGTQLEVNDAQTALTQAQTNQVNAQYDYLAALARLQRATGLPQ